MASFEDYDEFGNYIGADLDSDDEEEEVQQTPFQSASEPQPLAGFDEPMDEEPSGALMEVDGAHRMHLVHLFFLCGTISRADSQRGRATRRQAVLSVCTRHLWRGRRDNGSGRRCSTIDRTYHCAHKESKMDRGGEGYARDSL